MVDLSILDGCRVNILPGFLNPTKPGQQGSAPVVVTPRPTDPPIPPFRPPKDPARQPTPIPPFPGPGQGGGRPGRPDPNRPTTGGPTTGGPIPAAIPAATGPTTGGPSTSQKYQCQETRFICLEDLSKPLNQQRVRSIVKTCIPFDPAAPGSGLVASGTTGNESFVVIRNAVFNTLQRCQQVCAPANASFSVTCTGQPSLPSLSPATQANASKRVEEVIAQANIQQQNQLSQNSNQINVDKAILPQVQNQLTSNSVTNLIYDPLLNFFNITPSEEIIPKPNSLYLNIFRSETAREVSEILKYQTDTRRPWNENAIQSLTDSKLVFSLQDNVVEAFNNIRDVDGSVVGLSTFLEVLRSHLITGTLEEFNVNYFLDAYRVQKRTKFVTFNKSESRSSNELFSVIYLNNPKYNLKARGDTTFEDLDFGRFRFLNEDMGVLISAEKLSGDRENIEVPNEGIPVTLIVDVDSSTPISVGSPDLLNIGDGGGYYFHGTLISGDEVPIDTINLRDNSYYAPTQIKSSLLDLLDNKLEYVITAKSLSANHEFVSGDAGVDSLEPLYFGINLNSVTNYEYDSAAITNYSATYSLISDPSSIQTHMNNNALSIPEMYLDYRDPLYRYIKDTSSFEIKASDITLESVNGKPNILNSSNFPKNIPFGFVIIPSRGTNFNPFNVKSKITKVGDIIERQIKVGAVIQNDISKYPGSNFSTYNIFVEEGKKRIGLVEPETVHNIGYKYAASSYDKSYYLGGQITTSPPTVSSYGTSYMLKDIIDSLYSEQNVSSLLWFDIFSRMTLREVGSLFYDMPEGFLDSLENGYRNGIIIKNAPNSTYNPPKPLSSDSKTVVKESDRREYERIPL